MRKNLHTQISIKLKVLFFMKLSNSSNPLNGMLSHLIWRQTERCWTVILPGCWRIPDFCPVNGIFMMDPSVRRWWKKHLANEFPRQWWMDINGIIWFSMRRDLVIRWWWWWREYDGICWVYGNSDSTNAAWMSQNGFWRFGTLRHCNVHLTEISKPKLSH